MRGTCVVPELQPASGGADVPPPLLQAPTTISRVISEALTPRAGSNVMAFSSVAMTMDPAPSSQWPDRGESAPAQDRDYSIETDPDGPRRKLTLKI